MKILFLFPSIPYPPTDGRKLRTYNILKRLSKSHDIFFLCFADEKKDAKNIQILERECKNIKISTVHPPKHWISPHILNIFSVNPIFVTSGYSKNFENQIKQIMASDNFDIIYADNAEMAQYYCADKNIPKILDVRDASSLLFSQISKFTKNIIHKFYFLSQSLKMRRYEKIVYPKFNCVIVVSEYDATILRQISKDIIVKCIPNGVDFVHFKPSSAKTESKSLVFVGVMNYPPNVDAVVYFVRKIYPYIIKEVPGVKFYIVGKNPTKEIISLNGKDNIIVTGEPKDVRFYIDRAEISIAPLRVATGIQNKILEALAMGKPVVTTPIAAKGLKYITKENIIIAQDEKDFAQKVVILLKDKSLRKKLGVSGRDIIKRRYNWSLFIDEINKAMEDIIKHEKSLNSIHF